VKHPALRLLWVFLAAPWLAWVAFHPLADARLAWMLVAHPREARTAVVEMLRNAYDVPPFSYMFDAERQLHRERFHDAARRHVTTSRATAQRTVQSRSEGSHSPSHVTGGGRWLR
jgi:hypothetical protein